PTHQHFSCMIDALGRAGRLESARELAETMPFEAQAVNWVCVLGACRDHDDLEASSYAARRVLELDPKNGAVYVLLASTARDPGR
ncbi:hypothetical protein SELMODRAFT_38770, partial [Selaginella moellendorffii]